MLFRFKDYVAIQFCIEQNLGETLVTKVHLRQATLSYLIKFFPKTVVEEKHF